MSNAFYAIVDEIETLLQANLSVNTVRYGDIDEMTTRKATIFPLAHLNVDGVTYNGKTQTFSFSIILADQPSFPNTLSDDTLDDDDDEVHDIMNTMLAVGTSLLENLRRGNVRASGYHLVEGSANFDPFDERFEDGLAGWALTFDVDVSNTITICRGAVEVERTVYYVRPSGGSYGDEDGTSYANAWDGFSNIDWTLVAGNTLAVCGTHAETLVVGASDVKIIGNDANEAGVIDVADALNRCVSITDYNEPDIVSLQMLNALVDGLFMEDVTDAVTTDCTFSGSGNQGIQHFGNTTATHNNPTCDDNADDGVSGHDSAVITLVGGSYTNNDAGVNLVNSAQVTISGGPTFSGNTTDDVWVTNADSAGSCKATLIGVTSPVQVRATSGAELDIQGGVYTKVDVEDTLTKSYLTASDAVITLLAYKGSQSALTQCRVLEVENDNADTEITFDRCYVRPNRDLLLSGSLSATASWFVGDGSNHTISNQAGGVCGFVACGFTGMGANKFGFTAVSGSYLTAFSNNTFYGDGTNRGVLLLGGQTIYNCIFDNLHRGVFVGTGDTATAADCVFFGNGSDDFGAGTLTYVNKITGDPNQTDPANGDFTLGSGSSAIGTGSATPSIVQIDSATWGDATTSPVVTTVEQTQPFNIGAGDEL